MSFNLKTKALVDTCVLHLTDPANGQYLYADDAEKEPLEIVLYGRSSKQYRNWLAATMRKNEAADNRKKKSKSLDELTDDNAEFLAMVSKEAHNINIGEPWNDSKEMFKKLYADPSLLWVGEQVTEKLSELSSFLGQ